MITYTLLAAVSLMVVFVIGVVILKSELFSKAQFWIAYGIVVFFQLLTNGYLTGQNIVTYNSEMISGARIAYAPIEDLFFGFSLVTLAMFIWEKLGPTNKRNKDSKDESDS